MAWTWQSSLWERSYRGEGSSADHAHVAPTFLRLALPELRPGARVLDLGCGTGRVGLTLVEASGFLVGLDTAAPAVEEARAAASRAGLTRARFFEADAETANLPGITGWEAADVAVAHLCYSARLLAHAGGFLRPGGAIVCAAIHPGQWRETGRPSRFAVHETEVETHAAAAGLSPEAALRETDRIHFEGWGEARSYLKAAGLWDRWVRTPGPRRSGGRSLPDAAPSRSAAPCSSNSGAPETMIPRSDAEPGDPIRGVTGYGFLRWATGASGCWTK